MTRGGGRYKGIERRKETERQRGREGKREIQICIQRDRKSFRKCRERQGKGEDRVGNRETERDSEGRDGGKE